MNKKILTTIVGAALVAGSAVASAAGPTVYGSLHVSADSYSNKEQGATPSLKQGYVSSNFSRVGVKGDDDLGDGMKSVYQILAPLSVDTGASGLGGTLLDTYAGLSGAFGTARVGRMDSPVKDLSAVFNPFGTRVGDSRNITGGVVGALMNFDNRFSNTVRYDSPSIAGVTIAGQYASSESSAFSSTNSDVGSANVRWSAGPAAVGLGYEKHSTATDTAEKIKRVVGSFKAGPVTLAGLYEVMSDLAGADGADRKSAGVSATFTFGNSAVKALYVKTDKVDTSTTDNGAKMMAVGFDQNLSKNTQVYVVYATVDNKESGTFKTAGAGAHGDTLATVAGQDQSGISGGLVINF